VAQKFDFTILATCVTAYALQQPRAPSV